MSVKQIFAVQGSGGDHTSELEDTVAQCYEAGGGVVEVSGACGLVRDFDIPETVVVRGQGVQSAFLEWLGGDVESAVVTSNLHDEHGFARGAGIEDLTINANGQPGLRWLAPNEGCGISRVDILGPTGFGVDFGPANGRQAHQVSVHGLKIAMLPSADTVAALRMEMCRRFSFDHLTIDVMPGEPGPAPLAMELTTGCDQNTFRATHVENCSGVLLASTGPCDGNDLELDFNNPEIAPQATTFGANVGTFGVMIGPKGRSYILRISDRHGLDWLIADQSKGFYVPGKGGGSGITKLGPVVSARDTRNQPFVLSADLTQFTGDVHLPRYSNSKRPAPGKAARIIYNTSTKRVEYDNGTDWVPLAGTAA